MAVRRAATVENDRVPTERHLDALHSLLGPPEVRLTAARTSLFITSSSVYRLVFERRD